MFCFYQFRFCVQSLLEYENVDVTLSQVKKYDNKLVDFVDRMLKVIRDILDVDLTSMRK